MGTPSRGDKTYDLFAQLVAAVLNVAIGNEDSCVEAAIFLADIWLTDNPVGSGVRARSPAWRGEGSSLHEHLDAYNNGQFCAPHRE